MSTQARIDQYDTLRAAWLAAEARLDSQARYLAGVACNGVLPSEPMIDAYREAEAAEEATSRTYFGFLNGPSTLR